METSVDHTSHVLTLLCGIHRQQHTQYNKSRANLHLSTPWLEPVLHLLSICISIVWIKFWMFCLRKWAESCPFMCGVHYFLGIACPSFHVLLTMTTVYFLTRTGVSLNEESQQSFLLVLGWFFKIFQLKYIGISFQENLILQLKSWKSDWGLLQILGVTTLLISQM